MKKRIVLLSALMVTISASLLGQASWTNTGNNVATNSIRPKVLVYQDTAFVAFVNATGSVELKKNTGATWTNVGTFLTTDDQFDFEISLDGTLIISTVEKRNNFDNSAYEFFLQMREYDNGGVSIIEDEYIGFGPLGSNAVDVFDVAVNPQGGYGVVFRFNNSYSCTYMSKTGLNAWNSVLYNAVGGVSGVKDSKIIYSSEFNAGLIYSRNQTLAGGGVDQLVVHSFLHDATTSAPIQIVGPSNLGFPVEDNFNLVNNSDTLYITGRYIPTQQEVVLFHTIASNGSVTALASSLALSNAFDIRLIMGDDYTKYISCVEEVFDVATSSYIYPGKIYEYSASFTNPVLIGNLNFNDVGNMVGEYDFAVNYNGNPEFHVVFQYGPPFNNTKVRKYSCAPAPEYTYDAANNILSTTEILSGSPQYQWYDCSSPLDGVEVPGANASTFQPTATSGFYTVSIMNEGCNTQSDCIEIDASSASLSDLEMGSLHIYPNPTSEILTIELDNTTTIVILDVLGNKVIQQEVNKGSSQLNVSALNSGVYFIKTQNGKTQQFIKK